MSYRTKTNPRALRRTSVVVDEDDFEASPDSELGQSQRAVNEKLVIASLRAHEDVEASEVREGELREAAELREQLIGILGHDLRGPLSAIMMGAGLLFARGNLDEDDARIVERIVNSGNRMTRMIGQLLDFTRARLGGGLNLAKQQVDLGDLCRNAAEELEIGASTPVRCVVHGDVRGSWDADRISQVLSNIGGNAIEHSTPGTSVVLVAYADGPDAVVTITNTGAPIPQEVLPHLFEPFRRAKSAKRGTSKNLGLGLYIACEIVTAHGGKLVAQSAEGKTTFTARLPRFPESPISQSMLNGNP